MTRRDSPDPTAAADPGPGPGPRTDPGPLGAALVRAGAALSLVPRGLAWLLPVAWCALIFHLSSKEVVAPALGTSVAAAYLGNLAHPGAFGLLAVLLTAALAPREHHGGLRWATLSPERGLWVVVLCALYGFTDELHQATVDGRDASLLDLASDAVGAAFAVWTIRALTPPRAVRRGRLARILLAGLAASAAAAGLSTWYGLEHGGGPWPF